MQKLAQICFSLFIVLSTLQITRAEQDTTPSSTDAKGTIAIKYKFRWESLWDSKATLEEFPAEERSEYIDEALMEISSKLKRKHKIKTMSKYTILDYQNDEHVLVEYPNLRSLDKERSDEPISDAELRQLATHLLQTGVVNTLNILRDGQLVDVYNNEDYQKKADENLELARQQIQMDEAEIRMQRERMKKYSKLDREFKKI